MEHKTVIMAKRESKLIHGVEWFCEVLSENIKISVFLDKLLDQLEILKPNKEGIYNLKQLDKFMKQMPEIKYEYKIKKFIESGVTELHEHGKKAFDVFYEEVNELLKELTQAESLFTNDMMKYCGEIDEDMFYDADGDEDD